MNIPAPSSLLFPHTSQPFPIDSAIASPPSAPDILPAHALERTHPFTQDDYGTYDSDYMTMDGEGALGELSQSVVVPVEGGIHDNMRPVANGEGQDPS
jgi:hypothetical protein